MFDTEKNELLEFDTHEDFGTEKVQEKIDQFRKQLKGFSSRKKPGTLNFKRQVMGQQKTSKRLNRF